MSGHGEKLDRKQEALIAALLTEPTHAAAAAKAGVSVATVGRWLRLPAFLAAYRRARRELVEGAIGRIQGAAGEAVDTLLAVARGGAKEGDKVRAAVALLDHAFRGLAEAGTIHTGDQADGAAPLGTGDVVRVLSGRLREADACEMPPGEKARLTVSVADALLRAITVNVLENRLEALEAVLDARKDGGR